MSTTKTVHITATTDADPRQAEFAKNAYKRREANRQPQPEPPVLPLSVAAEGVFRCYAELRLMLNGLVKSTEMAFKNPDEFKRFLELDDETQSKNERFYDVVCEWNTVASIFFTMTQAEKELGRSQDHQQRIAEAKADIAKLESRVTA